MHFSELEETTTRSARNQSRIPKRRRTSVKAHQTQTLKPLELSEEKERPQAEKVKMGLQTFDKNENLENGSTVNPKREQDKIISFGNWDWIWRRRRRRQDLEKGFWRLMEKLWVQR